MQLIHLLLSLVLSLAGGVAQPAAPAIPVADAAKPVPAAAGNLSPESDVDAVLDALDARGKDLEAFTAEVTLIEEDNVGLSNTRTGRVWYQKTGPQDARMRVSFVQRDDGDRIFDEKIDYVLDGPWLIDRDHKRKVEIKRQVLRPGEKINLLKLGEGPFPLPIGQPKEEVRKLFDVTKEKLLKDDPKNTIHVKLVPRPGTQFEKKFSAIDVWVDLENHFPRRIDTADAGENNFRTTILEDLQINPQPGLTKKDFELPPVNDDEWERTVEPYVE